VHPVDLTPLPPIPAKRYFTIGEVSDLCRVKAHVLRYWEQEFTQLRPVKRRGNRRYYQHHEVLLIRRIRELLYAQGFTIQGARQQLVNVPRNGGEEPAAAPALMADRGAIDRGLIDHGVADHAVAGTGAVRHGAAAPTSLLPATTLAPEVRAELLAIRDLLKS